MKPTGTKMMGFSVYEDASRQSPAGSLDIPLYMFGYDAQRRLVLISKAVSGEHCQRMYQTAIDKFGSLQVAISTLGRAHGRGRSQAFNSIDA
jgi:hypothetical protein